MPIEKITSRKSSVVKNAAALLQKAENRSEAGLFMAEGARLCADAARSQTEIAACFFTENAAKKYKDYLDPVLKQTEHAYCIEEHIAPMLPRSTFGAYTSQQAPTSAKCRTPSASAVRSTLPMLDGS